MNKKFLPIWLSTCVVYMALTISHSIVHQYDFYFCTYKYGAHTHGVRFVISRRYNAHNTIIVISRFDKT